VRRAEILAEQPIIDVVLIGQGLAGTTLAWALHAAGVRVRVFDPDQPVTSSKIAAGLITPITGKALAFSSTYAAEAAAARRFYRWVEGQTGAALLTERTAVRLFASDAEVAKWAARKGVDEIQPHLLEGPITRWIDEGIVSAPHGGFAMRAAQLDTGTYLAASRKALDVVTATIDWPRDVALGDAAVTVGHTKTRLVVSCTGADAASDPLWAHLRFRPAKGEILDVMMAQPLPPVTLHHGFWVAPTTDPRISRIGATFTWDSLDQVPTEAARVDLTKRAQAFLQPKFAVQTHRAAVRPIIGDSRPVAQAHPRIDRLLTFNGLASKGALRSPLAATAMADEIVRILAQDRTREPGH
jgi:glycine oxidase